MAFNQKNPPWQRNAGHQSISNMQAIVSFPQAQPVYNPNLGLQQQQNISILPQIGLQQQQAIYSQTVQYPTNRPINALGFQNQPQSQPTQSPVNQGSSKFNPNTRVFSGTGVVTKLQNDYGFIDDEVFFHKNICVKGIIPKVGDRVLVDAAYNTNMPFKWNASRVQMLQSSNSNSSSVPHVSTSQVRSHTPMYNNVPPNASEVRPNIRNRYSPAPRKSPERHMRRSSNSRSKDEYDEPDRRRKRDDRESDRPLYREKHIERSAERGRERERSPLRKPSPKRRRVRSVPRYMVQVPKHSLTIKTADVLELRRRYMNLYIPSDFFISDIRWTEAFPPNAPFAIRPPCQFHIMHKDVDPPAEMQSESMGGSEIGLDPADADYLYSAKVMLMSTPAMSEFYEKCISRNAAGEPERHENERDNTHPTRLISFLVGMRGKNETMAIGGPWSPALDGANPHSDPAVLIRTAVRTCRTLTGIDLSCCSQWYRFVELYYRRSESYHKGRLIPPRVETVVIFLPDVRSCQPTRLDWEKIRLSYKASWAQVINSTSSSTSNSSSGSGANQVEEVPPPADSPSVVAQAAANAKGTDDVTKASAAPSAVEPSSVAAAPAAANVAEPAAPVSSAAAVGSEQPEANGSSATAATAGTAAQAEAAALQHDPAFTPAGATQASSTAVGAATAAAKAAAAAAAAVAAAMAASASMAGAEEKELNAPATRSGSSGNTSGITSAAVSIMDTSENLTVSDTPTDLVLDYKKMKVAELKAELSNRNLPTDGIKAILVSRLSEAIMKEQQELQELQRKSAEEAQLQKEIELEPQDTEQEEKMEVALKEELDGDAVMVETAQEATHEGNEKKATEDAVAAQDTIAAVPAASKGKDVVVEVKSEPKPAELETGAAVPAPVLRNKVDPVKLTEKEKQAMERRYRLPEKPHIIVHPSRVAKSGKFNCSVTSLSVLLDYRPEDTKEHSFEVALFAELFNEMLTRDFGFNIYRTLYKLPPVPKKEPEEAKKDGSADGGTKGGPLVDSSGTDNGEEGGKVTGGVVTAPSSEKGEEPKKKSHADEKDQRERHGDRKRALPVDSTDDERRSKDKEAVKSHVVNFDLLLSFRYFDISHCGYMVEKDLEDLISTLGLHLSRSQIRKTLAKATVRDMLHYRKLTDKVATVPPATQSEDGAPANADAGTDQPAESAIVQPLIDDAVAVAEKDVQLVKDAPEIVARGNTNYKTELKATLENLLHDGQPQQQQHDAANADTCAPVGIVEYNGCIVDVGKLLDQVQRAESGRAEAEKTMLTLQTSNEKLRSNYSRAHSKIKDLQSETKTLSKQLADSVRVSREAVQTQGDYYSIIQQLYDRIRPVVNKPQREGSWKRESSKEKSFRAAASKSKEKENSKDTTRKEEDTSGKEKDDPAKVEADGGDEQPTVKEQMQSDHAMDTRPTPVTDADVTANPDKNANSEQA